MNLRQDADQIIKASIAAVLPDAAVEKALAQADFGAGRLVLVAVGKAAWQMAKAASSILGERIDSGVVITKYGHAKGAIARLQIYEAGHPIPDQNSFAATEQAIAAVSNLEAADRVLFLLSGGGSALFEKPLVPGAALEELTKQLMSCGADIIEINTIRKRLSAVKGGRFAELCRPAQLVSIVLSDIIGDPLDMIASGPAYPDSSTAEQALQIVKKYNLTVTPQMLQLLQQETPKQLDNVTTQVTGSVRQLCAAAAAECQRLGYQPIVLTSSLCCTARDAGSFLASIAQDNQHTESSVAYIAGGETVVYLTGSGKGGRNQEIALAAAAGIDSLTQTAVFSVGSDGTDGPTDAAGGYCDHTTKQRLAQQQVDIATVLADNDAYHALACCDGLIVTGATGTNVNDLTVLLIKR